MLIDCVGFYDVFGGVVICCDLGFEVEGGIVLVIVDLVGNSVMIMLVLVLVSWLCFVYQVQDCIVMVDVLGVSMLVYCMMLFVSYICFSCYVVGESLWCVLLGFWGCLQGDSFILEV